jgi:TRAP-type C4-dicarboxylate transport system substrate-binding protein
MMAPLRSAIVIAHVCAGLVTSAGAAEVTLTAASFQPENVVFAKHFYQWVRETNRRCSSQVAIEVLDSDAIEPRRQWYALQTGEIDMYFGPPSFYRGALPQGDVFMLAHNDSATQRRNGAWASLNAQFNEAINAWYLTTLIAGVKFFVYTTTPANDGRFDGLRLRSVPLYENFLRSLGAETSTIPAKALGPELESGAIDGFVWPLWGLDVFHWDRSVSYRYGPGFLDAAAPVLVNLDTWKSLSDDQRDCLSEAAEWVEGEWAQWLETENAAQLAALEAAGVVYVDLGEEFARGAEDTMWAQLEQAEPAFVQQIRSLLVSSAD